MMHVVFLPDKTVLEHILTSDLCLYHIFLHRLCHCSLSTTLHAEHATSFSSHSKVVWSGPILASQTLPILQHTIARTHARNFRVFTGRPTFHGSNAEGIQPTSQTSRSYPPLMHLYETDSRNKMIFTMQHCHSFSNFLCQSF